MFPASYNTDIAVLPWCAPWGNQYALRRALPGCWSSLFLRMRPAAQSATAAGLMPPGSLMSQPTADAWRGLHTCWSIPYRARASQHTWTPRGRTYARQLRPNLAPRSKQRNHANLYWRPDSMATFVVRGGGVPKWDERKLSFCWFGRYRRFWSHKLVALTHLISTGNLLYLLLPHKDCLRVWHVNNVVNLTPYKPAKRNFTTKV